MPEQTRVTVAPGVALAVRVYPGLDIRPTAVLVHGLASSSRLWDGVAGELAARGYGAVAVDLRGHGESDALDGAYDTATAVADVVAVVEQTSPQRPVLLAGQSWGGNVALELSARRPDLVAGLALVDGGWIRLTARFPDWPSAREALTPPEIDGMPAESFRALLTEALADFPDGAVDAAMSVVRVRADGTIERRLPVPRHLEILHSLWEDDPRAWFPEVVAPTVLMPALADADAPIGTEVADAAGAIPRARVRAYRGAHHDLHLQRPAAVAADIGGLA